MRFNVELNDVLDEIRDTFSHQEICDIAFSLVEFFDYPLLEGLVTRIQNHIKFRKDDEAGFVPPDDGSDAMRKQLESSGFKIG